MQLRYVAALALVAWYLMIPVRDNVVYKNLPLSQWMIVSSYDKVEQCQKMADKFHGPADPQLVARAIQQANPKAAPDLTEALTEVQTLSYMVNAAVCVATDDPRLKGDPHLKEK
ncbi:MAG: hypothetical protein ACLQDV_07830 [Candidatus Binataceae bacterium]